MANPSAPSKGKSGQCASPRAVKQKLHGYINYANYANVQNKREECSLGLLSCGKKVSLVVWKAVKSQERAFDRVKNGRKVM